MANGYKDLLVWQKAMQLTTGIYAVTKRFPRDEQYGLVSQLRRAAVSVTSNIAEGSGRYSDGEFLQFLSQARGSALELETQLLIARELHYVDAGSARDLLRSVDEISRMLSGLRSSIHPRQSPTRNSQLRARNS
jgi:four helix bundle protein